MLQKTVEVPKASTKAAAVVKPVKQESSDSSSEDESSEDEV